MEKPENVETTFTFTWTQLRHLLWVFGTNMAVRGQKTVVENSVVTCHTDAWVIPAVDEQLEKLKPNN